MGDINFCSSVLLSKNKGSTQNMFFCQKEKGAHEICSFVLLSKKYFFCLKFIIKYYVKKLEYN